MTRYLSMCLGAVLALAAPLAADEHNMDNGNSWNCCPTTDCAYEDCCNNSFWIGADLLLYQPCVDDMDFALVSSADLMTNSFDARAKEVDHDWDPGVRVFLGKEQAYNGWDLYAQWSWIKSDKSATATTAADSFISDTLFHGGFQNFAINSVTAKHELEYHNFDLLWSRRYCMTPCNYVRPFIGTTGVYIDRKWTSTATNLAATNSRTAVWSADYWGIGCRFGAKYEHEYSDCLSFFSFASGAITFGDMESDHHYTDTAGPVDVRIRHKQCVVVPGWHCGGGMMYHKDWCGTDFALRLGWEHISWLNTPQIRRFVDNGINSGHGTSDTGAALGFNGLFVGLGIGF